MSTYLLTWNPDRWTWQDLQEAVEATATGDRFPVTWSAGNTKTISPGSRVFLLKQGPEPRGIVASGWTVSGCHDAPHWDTERASRGDTLPFVDVEFDLVLDPAQVPPLDTSQFTSGPLSEVYWAIPASGTRLHDDAAAALEEQWEEYVRPLAMTPKPMRRHLAWQRDEAILALDLYLRHSGQCLPETHAEVIALSNLLNALPIHPAKPEAGTVRTPDAVSAELLIFHQVELAQGSEGLRQRKKLEEEVWTEFSSDSLLLRKVTEAIKEGFQRPEASGFGGESDEEEVFPEGRIVYRLHRSRERSKNLVQKAKEAALRQFGKLQCLVCRFDFVEKYGRLGEGFIECHHTLPLSELLGEHEARLRDIATICPNCHRMVHRKRPWLSLEQLGAILWKR